MKANEILKRLSSLHQKAKLPHALGLVDGNLSEKDTLAFNLAKNIHCKSPHEALACNTCTACNKVNRNLHPDIFILKKEKREITVDEVRKLIRWLSISPHESSKKVAIVEEAQFLNSSSSNALLKTLEEPPEFSHLILISNTQDHLLPTIRSRLLTIRVNPGPQNNVDSESTPSWHQGMRELLQKKQHAQNADIFTFTQLISKDRENLRLFYQDLEKHIIQSFRHSQSYDLNQKLNDLFEKTLQAEYQTVIRYGNISLQTDELIMEWRDIWRDVNP